MQTIATPLNFLDKKNPDFNKLHNVIDSLFKQLRKEGVGSESKHSEIITKDNENQLWAANVLGFVSPTALLQSVFFYNEKKFCLRGGQEHRELTYTPTGSLDIYGECMQESAGRPCTNAI